MKYFSIIFIIFIATALGVLWYGNGGDVQYEAPRLTILDERALARQLRAEFVPFSGAETVKTVIEPIAGLRTRITKKPFGIYITPETSPVQPDRFDGYHTGVDIEYGDVSGEVPVQAITEGIVVFSNFVPGYGGVIVIRHIIKDIDIFVLYGHIDPSTMLENNIVVERGRVIGFLGEGGTEETDGVRKHLHFAFLKNAELDLRGYVPLEEDLLGWYDPLDFYDE